MFGDFSSNDVIDFETFLELIIGKSWADPIKFYNLCPPDDSLDLFVLIVKSVGAKGGLYAVYFNNLMVISWVQTEASILKKF
jgi:hypothetical protein